MTDRLAQSGHYTFHIGTPDPEMRRIASWMLTHENNRTTIAKFIPKIWKRGGREDLKLVGLLLANMSDEELGENGWTVFLQLVQSEYRLKCFSKQAKNSFVEVANSRMMLGFEMQPLRVKLGRN